MSEEAQQSEAAVRRVYRAVDRARRRWRVLSALRGLLLALVVTGSALVACLWADNLLHLPAPLRLACAVGLAALLLGMLARFMAYPLLRPLNDAVVAAHLERTSPELDNRLINAVLLDREHFRDPAARRMARAQIDDTARWVGERPAAGAPDLRGLWKPARYLALLAAVLGLYGLVFSRHFGNALLRLTRPGAGVPPVTDTRLDVRPGDTALLQGETLRVQAQVSGILPESARIAVRSGEERNTDRMSFTGRAFAYELTNLQRTLRYRISAGDARTRWYRVEVRRRPAVQAIDATYRYPDYTGLPERTETGILGDIRALAGTELLLRVHTDRPVQRGHLELRTKPGGEGEPRTVPLTRQKPGTLSARLTAERGGELLVHVRDDAGVRNLPQVRRLEVAPDAAPRVTFATPGRDVTAAPGDEVVLLAEATDDVALRGLRLLVQREAGGEWESIRSWRYDARVRRAQEGAVLALDRLGLERGDTLAYYMRASDGLAREQPVGRSRVYRVHVGGQRAGPASAPGDRKERASAETKGAESGEKSKEEEVSDAEDLPGGEQLAERLLRELERFGEAQERAIELSNRLGRKAVDDFTDEEKKALEEIREIEREWADFFQEAATDLSKLPPQDFSLAGQAEEFREVYSELQTAVEAVEREDIELAVPREQAGLELAEEIETNLEKWLTEYPDHRKWAMEEPLEDYETPTAELPDELQDLIGDLIESEEEMTEEIEDVTSGWMDSLDVGAGWDAMDGPISNMSARGVTGNRLPNSQEVGGRSGEGRTGKSSGEFVEKTATGKGGRPTPSRLTPDPYEAGRVEDTSGQPPTGATGGGKASGGGAEGFRGPVPPPLQKELKRLAARQRQLIDRAERIDYGLKKYRAPRGRLPETIELMKAQAAGLERGEVATFAGYRRVVLTNLREVKQLTEKRKQIVRERGSLLPKRLRDEIAAGETENVPERYRSMVRSYFRAISDAATPRE
ncbi:MAG: hypothetical protein ACOC7T_02335 [Planctomycetota bacterium]